MSHAAASSSSFRRRDPVLDAYTPGWGWRQNGAAGRPDFDSVLRAAPAYDDIDDDEDDVDAEDEDGLDADENTMQGDRQRASTSYLPESTSDLATLAQPYLAQHASLHAFLDANVALQATLTSARNQLHIDTGKLASRTAEANRLERVYSETTTAKKVLWTPKKRKAWRTLLAKSHSEHISCRDHVAELGEALEQDRRQVDELEKQMLEFKRVEGRLDTIDDMVFGAIAITNVEEKGVHRQFHQLHEIIRRLRSAIQLEERAQKHLDKAFSVCLMLTKELLRGLNIGIEVGVATNTKHKTQLWQGTSTLATARASRGLILRAKTLSGDLQTHYFQARAVQKRVGILPKLEVIALNKLPDMRGKGVVDELGLHRSLEQSYAQAKIVRTHVEMERQRSKERQKLLVAEVVNLKREARNTWLHLRNVRRNLMDDVREGIGGTSDAAKATLGNAGLSLNDSSAPSIDHIPPPYGHHIPSSSTLGVDDAPPQVTNAIQESLATSPIGSELTTVDSRLTVASNGRPGMLTDASFRKGARGLFAEARANDERVQSRQRRRFLTLPRQVRDDVEKESVQRSRALIRNIYVQVGGIVEDDDVGADVFCEQDDDLPGMHLLVG